MKIDSNYPFVTLSINEFESSKNEKRLETNEGIVNFSFPIKLRKFSFLKTKF